MSPPTAHGTRCRICNSDALHELDNYRNLPRVTSDCRPWKAGGRLGVCHNCGAVQKLIDAVWTNEINQIYETYDIYHQSGGKEQVIFTAQGTSRPRSVSLLAHLEKILDLPRQANVLDFGCGRGAALTTFSSHHPQWKLFGAELSAQNLSLLKTIPGFVDLFTCTPAEIPMRFELITLFHVLEHVLDPVETLHDLYGRLSNTGAFFVQVPDGAKNPYDLVIADHLLHFSVGTLRSAARRAGCDIVELSDTVLPKELTLIAQGSQAKGGEITSPDLHLSVERVTAQLGWLFSQIQLANRIAKGSRRFGVFGTSISGTWLAGALGDQVSFFVDEDPARIGGLHMGQPVLAPDKVPTAADVFVPLIPEVAVSVTQRLSRRAGARFYTPLDSKKLDGNQELAGSC